MNNSDISKLLKLGKAERLAIAEQLWASVASEFEASPASAEEIAFIDDRLDAYLKNPDDILAWPQVKRELGL